MSTLKYRPLFCAALIFIILSFSAVLIPPEYKIISACVITVITPLFVALCKKKGKSVLICLLCALSAVSAFAVSFIYFNIYYLGIINDCREENNIQAYVIRDISSLSYQNKYEIRITQADNKKTFFKAEITLPSDGCLSPGDIIDTTAVFSDFKEDISGYPEKKYKLSKGVFLTCDIREYTVTGKTATPYIILSSLSDKISARLDEKLLPDTAGFVKCVLLGDKSSLPAQVKRDFARLGISHMLAVSGLHISIVLGLLYAFLTLLTLHKNIKCAVMIPSAAAFVLISGCSASVIRASLMLGTVYFCYFIGKRADPLTSVCAVCALIMLINPNSVYDCGFIMSFAATFALCAFGEKIRQYIYKTKTPRLFRGALTALFVSAVIVFFTMPINCLFFGAVSAVSAPATLLFSPLLTVILYLSVFLLIFGGIPFITGGVSALLNAAVGFTLDFSDSAALSGNYLFSLDYPFVGAIIALFAVSAVTVFVINPKKKIFYFLPAALFVLSYGSCIVCYSASTRDNTYISVTAGTRSDILSVTKNAGTTLLDFSGGYYSNLYTASHNARKNEYITAFSSYVITNYHNQNVNSSDKLFSTQYFDTVYLPAASEENEHTAREIEDNAKAHGVDVIYYNYDESFMIDETEYTVYSPIYIKRSKVPIDRVKINAFGKSAAYIGAGYSETESEPPICDYLICGNYGAEYKTEFSYQAKNIFAAESAVPFWKGKNIEEYTDYTRFILN